MVKKAKRDSLPCALVLNKFYAPLDIISWKKAIRLYVKHKDSRNYHFLEFDNIGMIPIPVVIVVPQTKYLHRKHRPYANHKVIFSRDKYICQYCGSQCCGDQTIDHVIPKSRGGDNSYKNLVTACLSCNSKKANRTPAEAGMKIPQIPSEPFVILPGHYHHPSWDDYIWKT